MVRVGKKAANIKERSEVLPSMSEPRKWGDAIDDTYPKAVEELRAAKPLAVVCRIENGGPPSGAGARKSAAKPKGKRG